MAIASANVYVKLDFTPLLDQLGLIEIVAQMRYEEWARGCRENGNDHFDWDEMPISTRETWISTAREKLQEAMG